MTESRRGTVPARGMTAGDWQRLKLPMTWGTFLSYVPGEPDKCFLDLRTDAPDGTHDVAAEDGPVVSGVSVRGGLFDPRATAHACYEAAAREQTSNAVHGTSRAPLTEDEIAERKPLAQPLIAVLDWNTETERFELTTST